MVGVRGSQVADFGGANAIRKPTTTTSRDLLGAEHGQRKNQEERLESATIPTEP